MISWYYINEDIRKHAVLFLTQSIRGAILYSNEDNLINKFLIQLSLKGKFKHENKYKYGEYVKNIKENA